MPCFAFLQDQQQTERDQQFFIRILTNQKKDEQKQKQISRIDMIQMELIQQLSNNPCRLVGFGLFVRTGVGLFRMRIRYPALIGEFILRFEAVFFLGNSGIGPGLRPNIAIVHGSSLPFRKKLFPNP